jgi:hypothetical protein
MCAACCIVATGSQRTESKEPLDHFPRPDIDPWPKILVAVLAAFEGSQLLCFCRMTHDSRFARLDRYKVFRLLVILAERGCLCVPAPSKL